jgi:hypothetical protein
METVDWRRDRASPKSRGARSQQEPKQRSCTRKKTSSEQEGEVKSPSAPQEKHGTSFLRQGKRNRDRSFTRQKPKGKAQIDARRFTTLAFLCGRARGDTGALLQRPRSEVRNQKTRTANRISDLGDNKRTRAGQHNGELKFELATPRGTRPAA